MFFLPPAEREAKSNEQICSGTALPVLLEFRQRAGIIKVQNGSLEEGNVSVTISHRLLAGHTWTHVSFSASDHVYKTSLLMPACLDKLLFQRNWRSGRVRAVRLRERVSDQMPSGFNYFGRRSETRERSSLSSLTVASIFWRLNSLMATPWTISSFETVLRSGKDEMRPFSTP